MINSKQNNSNIFNNKQIVNTKQLYKFSILKMFISTGDTNTVTKDIVYIYMDNTTKNETQIIYLY